MDTNKEIFDFAKEKLKELLEQCTEGQKKLFYRAYGEIDSISPDKIKRAVNLVERTIKKNLETI